jgi:hypothetical protein
MDPEAKRGRTREPLYAAKNTRPTRLARRKADDRARCLTAEIVAARDLDVRRQLDQTRSCAHECRRQLGIGDPKPLRTSGYYRCQPSVARGNANALRGRLQLYEASSVDRCDR